jgi:hypothetical protein
VLLKSLEVINSQGLSLLLPLEDMSEGFIVREIEGLGPVKATLVSSSFANLDGEQFHSSRRDARNIVIKLGLDPEYGEQSVGHLRAQLYDFFMPKTEAQLIFTLFDKFEPSFAEATQHLHIKGRVETTEPDIFTKDPSVNVSLMCFESEFYEPDPVIFSGQTVTDLTEVDLNYKGTLETGVVFRMFVNRSMSGFVINHRPPNNTLHQASFQHSLLSGDILTISSVVGKKHVTLDRGGNQSSVLYSLSPTPSWVELLKGINKIRVTSDGSPVPYEIEYTAKFGGI